jgi:hypothetical protein
MLTYIEYIVSTYNIMLMHFLESLQSSWTSLETREEGPGRLIRGLEAVVSRLDRQAILPVYPVVREYVANHSNIPDLSTSEPCPLLYPSEEEKATLEYLPVCRSLGVSESSLLLGDATKLDIKDMTNALVIEVYQYVGKYGSCLDVSLKCHLYNILFALFQVGSCNPVSLWSKAERAVQSYQKKHRPGLKTSTSSAFLSSPFSWPVRSKSAGPSARSRVSNPGNPVAVSSTGSLLQKVKTQSDTITDLTGQRRDLQRETQMLRRTVSESQLNVETLESTLDETTREMINATRREDYQRARQQKQKVELETSLGK